jgi:hypothetical protein
VVLVGGPKGTSRVGSEHLDLVTVRSCVIPRDVLAISKRHSVLSLKYEIAYIVVQFEVTAANPAEGE